MAIPRLNQPPVNSDSNSFQFKKWFTSIWRVLRFFYNSGNSALGINTSTPVSTLGVDIQGGTRIGTMYVSPTNPNTLNAGYNSGTDIWINYHGSLDGITQFRDFRIGDGKGNQLFQMIGSTGNATFQNTVIAAQFNGSGAGLTGTAAFLTAGAVTSIAGNSLTSTQVFNAINLADNTDWYRVGALGQGYYNHAANTGLNFTQVGRVDIYDGGSGASLFVPGTTQATQFRCDATYNSAATAQVDFSNQATSFSLVASGTTTLPVGAGVLIICDTSTTGQTAIYILGGGTLSVLSSSTAFIVSATPSSATGISWNGSAYVIKNGNLATRTYHMAFLKIRAAN